MPNTAPGPVPAPSPTKSIVFAILAAGIIGFAIWGGLQANAAGGDALSEWQEFIVAFMGGIGVLIAAGFTKQQYDAKKVAASQQNNTDKLGFFSDILAQQSIQIANLTKQNNTLSNEIRDLKYKIETLSRDNISLSKQIKRYEKE